MIDEDDPEAIRQWVRAAESYFQKLDNPTALFAKPWVPSHLAGYNLARVGYLLEHLRAGVNQTVLDFGAGMCWLSIVLAQRGCRVTALDVSKTALRLGEEAFRRARLPSTTRRPRFLTYDGFRFPLRDESMDRIACYDALHHVPNKRTILGEMCRVLKRDGIVCFVEPGPGHSTSSDSLLEVQEFGVLEDEVDAAKLVATASEVGFEGAYLVPLVHPSENMLDPHRYVEIHGGERKGVLDWDGNDALVVLTKSVYLPDAGRMRAGIKLVQIDASTGPAQEFSATLEVRNDGNTNWTALPDDPTKIADDPAVQPREWLGRRPRPLDYDKAFLKKDIVPGRYRNKRPVARYRKYIERNLFEGTVTVGVKLGDGEGTAIDRDYARGFLPEDVMPGDSCEVQVRMRAPRTKGIYELRFDLVQEYVTWFAATGSPVALDYINVGGPDDPADSRSPSRLQAALRVVERPQLGVMVIAAQNVGDTVWLRGPLTGGGHVRLGAQRLDDDGVVEDRDWIRVALPRCVAPGEEVRIRLDLSPEVHGPAPASVKIDMVSEGVCWFEEHGSQPLDVCTDGTDTDARLG